MRENDGKNRKTEFDARYQDSKSMNCEVCEALAKCFPQQKGGYVFQCMIR